MNQSASTIFKKLSNLEQEVQRLKVQAYFNLPRKQQIISFYPQESINKALRDVRDQMWQARYAKKAQGLS